MLTWLKALLPAAGGLAGVLTWWKVAAIGLGVLAASNGITALYAYNVGHEHANNAHLAAKTKADKQHSEWLVRLAGFTGVLTADDAAIEIDNEQLQRRLEDEIAKASIAAGNPSNCVPADVLHAIARFR
jgi:hypothetical protein